VAKLVPIQTVPPKRRFGAMRGQARVDAAFFEPLPEGELKAWAGVRCACARRLW
jgi:antitoxin (DNA-binding transcriptional repressor) of toxin-antitoxin stability system